MPNPPLIVGLMLVRNEDRYFDRVVGNALPFCDLLWVADHGSSDATPALARRWQERDARVRYQAVRHPVDAHELVRPYCGQAAWVLGLDGDEIYDPAGLARLREQIRAGALDRAWSVYGHVLNCTLLDEQNGRARGYLAPPCRSMTKLYNFGAITDWRGVETQRLHGGHLHFKAGWSAASRLKIHEQYSWAQSPFRCLHACFLPRSRAEAAVTGQAVARLNVTESLGGGWWQRWMRTLAGHSRWKEQKYRRGPEVELEVSAFFPPLPGDLRA